MENRVKIKSVSLNKTEQEWKECLGVLLEGEVGYDLTNKIIKIGDGTHRWDELPPFSKPDYNYAGVANILDISVIPETKTIYITNEPGIYQAYGDLVVFPGELCIFNWDGESWSKDILNKKQVIPFYIKNESSNTNTLTITNFNQVNLQYNTNLDQEWKPITENISLVKDEIAYFKGDNLSLVGVNFNCTSDFSVGGNITTLLNSEEIASTLEISHAFENLFKSSNVIDASDLDLYSTTLSEGCYKGMFSNCTKLVKAPKLIAETLASYCYESMFENCVSLLEMPELPATSLAECCYLNMFKDCASLVQGGVLPATTLTNGCYSNMFKNCISLKHASNILATTLANDCFASMFENTSIINSPKLDILNLSKNCYGGMFKNCKKLINIPELPAITLVEGCYNSMFEGCTSIETTPIIKATTLNKDCCRSMFKDCISLQSTQGLSAKALALNGQCEMFKGCKNLNKVSTRATTWSKSDILGVSKFDTADWLKGTAASGTLYKPKELVAGTEANQIPTNSTSGIPTGWTTEDSFISTLEDYTNSTTDDAFISIENGDLVRFNAETRNATVLNNTLVIPNTTVETNYTMCYPSTNITECSAGVIKGTIPEVQEYETVFINGKEKQKIQGIFSATGTDSFPVIKNSENLLELDIYNKYFSMKLSNITIESDNSFLAGEFTLNSSGLVLTNNPNAKKLIKLIFPNELIINQGEHKIVYVNIPKIENSQVTITLNYINGSNTIEYYRNGFTDNLTKNTKKTILLHKRILKGKGIETDPFLVNASLDLNWLKYNLDLKNNLEDSNTYQTSYFKQIANISGFDGGIGSSTAFQGVYDGNGKNIILTGVGGVFDKVGGQERTTIIKGLNVLSSTLKGNGPAVGGVVNEIVGPNVSIINCTSKMRINVDKTGSLSVGGICGKIGDFNNIKIEGCSFRSNNQSTIKALQGNNLGGICGSFIGIGENILEINNCASRGQVSNIGINCGSVVGYVKGQSSNISISGDFRLYVVLEDEMGDPIIEDIEQIGLMGNAS